VLPEISKQRKLTCWESLKEIELANASPSDLKGRIYLTEQKLAELEKLIREALEEE